MKLKTLKDLTHGSAYSEVDVQVVERNRLKKEVIKWIKKLRVKDKEHWRKLDKYHYVGFPKIEGEDKEDCYGFKFEGEWFSSWHEASDVTGAVKILKLLHNITEEDLK